MTKPAVHAVLSFLANRESASVYVPSVAGSERLDETSGEHQRVSVPVTNARDDASPERPSAKPTLAQRGFTLVEHPLPNHHKLNLYDDEHVQSIYHPLAKKLLLDTVPGARRVEIFDDTRRSSSSNMRKERTLREPSGNVHNDYSERSGFWRLQGFVEQEYPDDKESFAEYLDGRRRFAIVNIWRSTTQGNVQNWPLVLADATTVAADDVVPVERKAANGRRGEIQLGLYRLHHQWYYYPQMTPDEALVFQTFDSAAPSRTLHSSFDDPTAPDDAPPRQSIETRCFVFF